MTRFPKTRIHVELDAEIETCAECPFVKSERTEGAGYAFDYYCNYTKNGVPRKVMGYVEYSADMNPVPDWCMIRI